MLLDLKRSDWLPPYDDEGVRIIITEMDDISRKLVEINDKSEDGTFSNPVKTNIAYHSQCLQRNIRYINSYMTHRNDKIRQIRWEAGTVLPDIVQQETLSDQERVYFNSYSDLLSEYSQSLGIDLTSNLEPPKDLLIEIRVLQSCGEIMTESGPVELTKGTTNFLRRSEVEHLIREGLVEHVQNEDTC
jgi:GINS complex subunit 1